MNQDLFEKSYDFLNDYKKSEMDMLKESIKKEQDPDAQEHMKGLLMKMVTQTTLIFLKKNHANYITGVC